MRLSVDRRLISAHRCHSAASGAVPQPAQCRHWQRRTAGIGKGALTCTAAVSQTQALWHRTPRACRPLWWMWGSQKPTFWVGGRLLMCQQSVQSAQTWLWRSWRAMSRPCPRGMTEMVFPCTTMCFAFAKLHAVFLSYSCMCNQECGVTKTINHRCAPSQASWPPLSPAFSARRPLRGPPAQPWWPCCRAPAQHARRPRPSC